MKLFPVYQRYNLRPYLKINKRNKQKYFVGWEDRSAEKVLAAMSDDFNPTDLYDGRKQPILSLFP